MTGKILVLNDQGGGVMSVTENVVATLRAQEHGHQPIVCYIIDPISSNSMKSNNPHSGFHQTDVCKCLDTSCLNPSCNQGG